MGKADDTPSLEAEKDLTEGAVLDYLLRNPDFLMDHPEVLVTATPPQRFGTGDERVVDIQHVMLRRLQAEMADLQDCAEQLIMTTRSNMATQKGTLKAAMAVLDSEGLGSLMRAVTEDLPLALDVDVCALRLEEPPAGTPAAVIEALAPPPAEADGAPQAGPLGEGLGEDLDLCTLPPGFVEAFFGAGAQAVLRPLTEAEAVIYGDVAGVVRSDALVRIDPGPGLPPGLLALGSRIEGTFEPEMAMDLLVFLARVVENSVRRWALDPV